MPLRLIFVVNDNLLDSVQAIFRSWFVDYDPFDGVCPSNWETGCVEDIAEFFDSMRKPLSSLERTDMERIYPYYGAVSIVDYVDDYIFDGEYLLVSEDGIYVVDENGHPLIQHISGKFWANNHAHILKGKSGFNEDSLYLFLANTNMAPIVTGAAQPKINQANLEAQAEAIYNEMIANNSTNGTMSTLGEISTIKTGKLNSEAAVINGIYPFFTCSQETYRTNTFSFDQEAVLLAGNNASAIYPLKIYCGKFDVYQRTYVISSNNRFVSNKQLYFVLKQQLNEFKGISSGTTTKFLTMKILTPIPVVIAPEDIATSFINITNKIFETIFQNQREIEHLRELQMIVLGELSRD